MILINRILRNFRTIRILRLVSIFGYVLENIMCNNNEISNIQRFSI